MSVLPQLRDSLVRAAWRQQPVAPPKLRMRMRRGFRVLPALLALAVAAIVGVVAVTQLRHRANPRSVPGPAATGSALAAGELAHTRQQLLRTLGVLRVAPDAASRRAISCFGVRHAPSSSAFRACLTSPVRMFVVGAARSPTVTFDRSLVRVVALPQIDASVTLVPARWQPASSSRQPVEGVEVEIAYLRGATATGPKPTTVATVRTHGLAVSDANATPQMRSVIGAVVVPDGVTKISLRPTRIISPPVVLNPHRFGAVTIMVHHNVAAFRFSIPTATNHQIRSALYGVTVLAKATWFYERGKNIRHTTTPLYLSIRVHGRGFGGDTTIP